MQITDEGLALLKRLEGFRGKAYKDSAGVWTIGYGHTSDNHLNVTASTLVNEAQASRLLRIDLAEAERAIDHLVRVSLTPHQRDTLIIFVFNIGEGAFAKSTLLRKLNAGDYDAVPSELGKWVYVTAGGKKVRVQGLVNRRAAEAGLWARESFAASRDVAAAGPAVPSALLSPEVIAPVAGLVSAGGAFASGSGPVQWALAIGLVVCVLVGAVYAVRRIRMAAA